MNNFSDIYMCMKPYHKLECPDLESIQKEALVWLTERYNLSDQSSLETDLWLKLDTKSFLKSNPTLIAWFRELNLTCREVAITVINDYKGAGLHIDELPTVSKINIPILNYQHVINEWYRVPENLMSMVNPMINRFGSAFYFLGSVDIEKCDLIGSVELQKPMVFNSQIPHRVVCKPEARFPRVVLTCMFFNEPVEYLNLTERYEQGVIDKGLTT